MKFIKKILFVIAVAATLCVFAFVLSGITISIVCFVIGYTEEAVWIIITWSAITTLVYFVEFHNKDKGEDNG